MVKYSIEFQFLRKNYETFGYIFFNGFFNWLLNRQQKDLLAEPIEKYADGLFGSL